MRDTRLWLVPLLLLQEGVLSAEPIPVTAHAVLVRHCASCHGEPGKSKGGFDYVLDPVRLVARGQVDPGRVDASPLWQRVASGEMPPQGKPALTEDEKKALRTWIQEGARDWRPAVAVAALSPGKVARLVRADLGTLAPRQRPYQRYVTFAHLAALPDAAPVLVTHRQALTKLVNALSWSPRLVAPTPIDPGRLVYRLDLRDYRWNPRVWDRLVTTSPYPGESDLPLVRGDWFVATASRPPFYYDFLQLPSTEKGLERVLMVDAAANLQEDRVLRAGFTNSGVARHNRVLERHDSAFGAYWRSYDFSDNLGRQNVLEAPLGPAGRGHGFQHDGGEMIFALPNGLHAYFISDAAGRRIERAPVEIVSDPKRPDRAVEVGVSCFSCHTQGYLPREDMVRARVLRDPQAFPEEVREQVLAIYPTPARFKAQMDDDNLRFRKALATLEIADLPTDAIEAVVLRYEAVIDATSAAAEVGRSPEELGRLIRQTESLRNTLGALLAPRGNVPRIVWEEQYPTLARSLERTPVVGVVSETPGHTDAIRALARGPGDRLISGGADRRAVVWDARTLTPIRRLEGHTNEVVAVAFRNEREVLTASLDRTVRLWDLATGKELRRFEGATDRLRELAVTPDGRYLFAGGDDGQIRGWEVGTGRLVFRLAGHRGGTLALASDPTGGTLASAGRDGVVRRWELARGTELAALEIGLRRPVRSLAFSSDGTHLVVGGEDRRVLVITRAGKTVWESSPGPNTTILVGYQGDQVVTVCSQYRAEDVLVQVHDAKSGQVTARLSGVGLGRVEVVLVEQRQGRLQAVVAQGEKLRRLDVGP